ncbi:MAG: cupredoxin domain-containing protein [Nitrososphaerales archaeon]
MKTIYVVALAVGVAVLVGISSLFVSAVVTGRPIMSGQRQQGATYDNGMMGSQGSGGGMMSGQGSGSSGSGMMGESGMMGNGGASMMNGSSDTQNMMSGTMNSPSSIDNATFNTINSPPRGVVVNRTSNTVYVGTSGVTIPVEASPLWYPQPGDYWLVYGLVNPTIVIKQGETVNFLFINMDNETHVSAMTAIAPPYSYMPMMGGGSGGTQSAATWLAIGPMLPGVSNTASSNQNPTYSDALLPVTFSSTGTFWYLCLYPGHAQM